MIDDGLHVTRTENAVLVQIVKLPLGLGHRRAQGVDQDEDIGEVEAAVSPTRGSVSSAPRIGRIPCLRHSS